MTNCPKIHWYRVEIAGHRPAYAGTEAGEAATALTRVVADDVEGHLEVEHIVIGERCDAERERIEALARH